MFLPVKKVARGSYEWDGFAFEVDDDELGPRISMLKNLKAQNDDLIHLPEIWRPAVLQCLRLRLDRTTHFTLVHAS